MSALLRLPHGFEGLGLVPVKAPVHKQPVSKGQDLRVLPAGDLDPGRSAPHPLVDQRDYAVPGVKQLVLELDGFPSAEPLTPPTPDGFLSAEDASHLGHDSLGDIKLDVRMPARGLTLAAQQAQIIGLAPRLIQGDHPRVDARSLTAAATEEKIGWIRQAAGDRFGELELNTYPAGGPAVVTGQPRAEARRRADRIRERTGAELTAEEILDSPHMFIGSIKDLTGKFVDLRERFGISSFLIDDLDALAPVVEELAGQ